MSLIPPAIDNTSIYSNLWFGRILYGVTLQYCRLEIIQSTEADTARQPTVELEPTFVK
jgi:hypothetical protein